VKSVATRLQYRLGKSQNGFQVTQLDMKNKLTHLSILALVVLIGAGALILVFNPFNGTAFALSSPVSANAVHHNINGNATSSSPAQSSSSGLPISFSSPSGTQQNHHNDDGPSSGADSG
jgi:hypothetical protein